MNIETANAISMPFFLEILGFKPSHETPFSAIYLSPIRNEKTASFNVNKRKNTWFDHGIGTGGDMVTFVCKYLAYQKEHYTVSDALRFIKNMSGFSPKIADIQYDSFEGEKTLELKSVEHLSHQALLNYLGARGINLYIAMDYLRMIKVYNKNSGKQITALGFKNDNEGYEVRNKGFKGCVGSKYITFVRGRNPDSGQLHIFEGVMDFLTFLTIRNTHRLEEDAIVLNSLACLSKATPYINNYGYQTVVTYMDNDPAGDKATIELAKFFETQTGLVHKPMNKLYEDHKDINAWHMHNHNLKL